MFGLGENRSDWIVDASGVFGSGTTEFVCTEEGVRFGREPKCVRGKTVIP